MTARTEQNVIILQFRIATFITIVVIAIGVAFYHFVEKLSLTDALYFCITTLTTVGYGDITPQTTLGKMFTVAYILTGVSIIATFVNLALRRASIRWRNQHTRKDGDHI